MVDDTSALERSMGSADFCSPTSIEPRSLASDAFREKHLSLLDRIRSPEKLVDLQLKLSEEEPYFALCTDEAIAAYFSKWGIPISTKRELELFGLAIDERI